MTTPDMEVSERDNVIVDEPAKHSMKTIQETAMSILPKEGMVLETLVGRAQRITPRVIGAYERVLRSEFVTRQAEDTGLVTVFPEISDHGAKVIAQSIAKRGISHYWLEHSPDAILAKATELGIKGKVEEIYKKATTPKLSLPKEDKAPASAPSPAPAPEPVSPTKPVQKVEKDGRQTVEREQVVCAKDGKTGGLYQFEKDGKTLYRVKHKNGDLHYAGATRPAPVKTE